jgi:hypothetical protein
MECVQSPVIVAMEILSLCRYRIHRMHVVGFISNFPEHGE